MTCSPGFGARQSPWQHDLRVRMDAYDFKISRFPVPSRKPAWGDLYFSLYRCGTKIITTREMPSAGAGRSPWLVALMRAGRPMGQRFSG
jgi:hypothetical protein